MSKYLPEYANLTVLDGGEVRPARTVMTVEHLMTMQGGLDYDTDSEPIRACLAKYGQAATTRQLAAAFVQKPLLFDPGTHFRYSLCHDVMAAVIEVASGLRFGEYLRRNVTEPLGMRCMGFFAQRGTAFAHGFALPLGRAGAPRRGGADRQLLRISEAHESGGGGLMGDVDSYILLPEALANERRRPEWGAHPDARVHRRDAQKPPDGRFAARLRRALREARLPATAWASER